MTAFGPPKPKASSAGRGKSGRQIRTEADSPEGGDQSDVQLRLVCRCAHALPLRCVVTLKVCHTAVVSCYVN